MRIENTTTLTKGILIRFNFANLLFRLRFNLVIFPLLMLACAAVLYQTGGTFLYVIILICFAVVVPIVLLLANTLIFKSGLKNYPLLNKVVKTSFSSEGFYIHGENGEEKMIGYNYVKECVEFKRMFIVYFKGASPMAIDKKGFSFGDPSGFKSLMKKSIDKRSKRI